MKTLITSLLLMGAMGLSAQSTQGVPTDLPGERSALSVRASQYPRIFRSSCFF